MFRRFFAFVLSCGFFLAFIGVVYLAALFSLLSQEGFYKEGLSSVIYESVIEEAPKYVELGPYSELVSSDDLENVFSDVVKEDEFYDVFSDLVDELSDLEVVDKSIDLKLDLVWFKDKSYDFVVSLGGLVFEKTPFCSDLDPETAFNSVCRLPELSKEMFVDDFSDRLRGDFLSSFPDEFVFSMETPDDLNGSLNDFISSAFKSALLLNVLFLCSLLFFISLVIFSPLSSVVNWVFVNILLGSTFVFIVSSFTVSDGIVFYESFADANVFLENFVVYLAGAVSDVLIDWMKWGIIASVSVLVINNAISLRK